jgi:DNA adenine methylase
MRYHGGKWLSAPRIIRHFPPHRVYVEPFGGAASVLLRKPRSYAEVYNDLDDCLVNLFRVVRDRGDELAKALYLTPFSRTEYKAAMARSDDPVEDARLLVMRSFMGFGSDSFNPLRKSGFRANSNRSSTTPAHDWANYPDCLASVVERLRGVVIENRDAREVMEQQDSPRTLHYCDPPYVWATRRPRAHSPACYLHEMTDGDHRDLAAFLRGLSGMVILSGYRCELYDELYGDWRSVNFPALADGARPREETLWFSPNCPADDGMLFDGRIPAAAQQTGDGTWTG